MGARRCPSAGWFKPMGARLQGLARSHREPPHESLMLLGKRHRQLMPGQCGPEAQPNHRPEAWVVRKPASSCWPQPGTSCGAGPCTQLV